MTDKAITLKEHLISLNQDYTKTFNRLESAISSIFDDKRTLHYQYPAGSQALESFRNATDLISSAQQSGSGLSQLSDKLSQPARLWAFDKGKAPGLVETFLWTKRAAIKDLGSSLLQSLDGTNLITSIVLVRPILEHVGAMSLFAKEQECLFDKRDILVSYEISV